MCCIFTDALERAAGDIHDVQLVKHTTKTLSHLWFFGGLEKFFTGIMRKTSEFRHSEHLLAHQPQRIWFYWSSEGESSTHSGLQACLVMLEQCCCTSAGVQEEKQRKRKVWVGMYGRKQTLEKSYQEIGNSALIHFDLKCRKELYPEEQKHDVWAETQRLRWTAFEK